MLLGGARHWLFLGQLCAAIPTLVLWKGADALSICLNAVALLFLAEIDNALYHFGLSASVRVRVERARRPLDPNSAQKCILAPNATRYPRILVPKTAVLREQHAQ